MTLPMPPPWSTRRHAVLFWMLLPLCLVLAADTLAWVVLQDRLARHFDALAARAAPAGWQLRAASRSRGGWPFSVRLTLSAPTLAGPARWSAERMRLSMALLAPDRITVRIQGVQAISIGPPGAELRLLLRGAPLLLDVADPAGEPGMADFETGTQETGMHETGTQAGSLSLAGRRGALRIERAEGRIRWTTQAVSISVSLPNLGLPDRSRADGFLEASVGQGGASSGGAMRLLVSQARLRWPDSMLQASGQAKLDEAGLAEGRFSLRIGHPNAVLGRLVRARQVTPSAATAIAAVLGLVAAGQPGADQPGEGEPAITLPITLSGGMVRLGEITLLRLPALHTKMALP